MTGSDFDELGRRLGLDPLSGTGVPGVAVGVARGDETRTFCFGVTSVDNPLAITDQTLFQIGSISKTMLGVVVAQLVTEGLIDIDRPVVDSLPDRCTVDRRITMRHLLTHRSGIDSQHMIGDAPTYLSQTSDDSIAASLAYFADDPLMFEPGADYSYSGPGFMVAAAVIEQITGMSWRRVLDARVLEPAGMSTTFTTADEAITYRVASPHNVADGQPYVSRDAGWQRHWQLPGWDVPGGGVISSADNLLRYARYVHTTSKAQPHWQPLADRGGAGGDIGYAWKLDTRGGHLVAHHDGLTSGYSSRIEAYPHLDASVVILTNAIKADSVKNWLGAVITNWLVGASSSFQDRNNLEHQPDPRHADGTSIHDRAVGRYDCGFYGIMELRKRPGGRAFELIAVGSPGDTAAQGSYVVDSAAIPSLLPDGMRSFSSDPTQEFPVSRLFFATNERGDVDRLIIHDRIARRVSSGGDYCPEGLQVRG